MKFILIQRNLATAAIAAACTLRTEVVSAGIFGAVGANARGFFFADGAEKRHVLWLPRSPFRQCLRQIRPAALSLVLDHLELLFFLVG